MGQQYVTTLGDMVGHVMRVKPTADPTVTRDFINQAIRTAIDRNVVWSGLIRRGVIEIPDAYITGTIALTNGSTTITGTSTAWPVSDKVSTTSTAAVSDIGLQWITPVSMAGIDVDSILYVDASGTPEIVTVMETTASKFRANFQSSHTTSFTITASSLAGRQLKLSINLPIYTVRAIVSTTSAILDMAWAGASVGSQAYQIQRYYFTLSPDLKALICAVDPQQPLMLYLHMQEHHMAYIDPQRMSTGLPYALADIGPNENGNMQYEIYPHQVSARQIYYMYTMQWPELRANGDRPPYFINPNVFIFMALSQELMRRRDKDDVHYDPVAARAYALRAEAEYQSAWEADQSKAQQQLDFEIQRLLGPGGANWAQSHAVNGNYESSSSWW